MLARYSEVFNAVEGNTTFYADPSPDVVKRWLHSSDEHLRFTFKFLACNKQFKRRKAPHL